MAIGKMFPFQGVEPGGRGAMAKPLFYIFFSLNERKQEAIPPESLLNLGNVKRFTKEKGGIR